MTRLTLWSSSTGDVPANLAFTNNFAATAAPTASNDITQGYTIGSNWVWGNLVYECTVQTAGAAVWVLLSEGETVPAQISAPAASTPTGTGSVAFLKGGAGGTTSGAGGEADLTGGAATAGNSAGGAAKVTGGAGSGSSAGGVATVTGGLAGATGAGGAANVVGGAGGATSGDGGAVAVTGGAGTAGNGNGGSIVLTGGAANGTGVAGAIRTEGLLTKKQSTPAAKTGNATLTAAELLSGIITVTNATASAQQFPTGSAIQAGLSTDFAIDDSFDVSVINLGSSTGIATMTVNTDVTIVGNAAVPIPAVGVESSGVFRLRKTADHVFVAYRIT